jgi:hypothetical protein
MPKIYEYFGLYIFFYSNDHLPIHIHVEYADRQCKVEFIFKQGGLLEFKFLQIGEAPLLRPAEIRKLRELLAAYSDEIIKKWELYHIRKEKIKPVKITKRLK